MKGVEAKLRSCIGKHVYLVLKPLGLPDTVGIAGKLVEVSDDYLAVKPLNSDDSKIAYIPRKANLLLCFHVLKQSVASPPSRKRGKRGKRRRG